MSLQEYEEWLITQIENYEKKNKSANIALNWAFYYLKKYKDKVLGEK